MTRRRDPTTIAATAFGVATAIAHLADPATAATRGRQLHEINPGAWHTTNAVTPDTCTHCTDEETRP